jgi:hypothetical protein
MMFLLMIVGFFSLTQAQPWIVRAAQGGLVMQYDRVGRRALPVRRVKLALYVLEALVAVTAPVFVLPNVDLTSLAEMTATDGMLDLR